MGLTGQQRAQLAKALLAAFPQPSALEQMIRFELDKSLAEISIATDLRSVVFKLIADAEAGGWTSDLLRGARRASEGNAALLVLAQQLAPYLGGLGEPLPPPPPPPLPGGPNLLDLALPVARALQAAGNEAHPYVRADRLVRAFERALSLVAAVLVAGYVRRLHAGGDRLASMDEAIAALRLPGP